MRVGILFLSIILQTSLLAQNGEYKSLKLGFTGVFEKDKNIITEDLSNRSLKKLGLSSSEGYEFIANESNGYIIVGFIKTAGNSTHGRVVFENNSIVQTVWSKSLLDNKVIEQCRIEAVNHGLKKDETDFGLFKFDKGGIIWYELGGTIDGVYGHMILNEKMDFISKESFVH